MFEQIIKRLHEIGAPADSQNKIPLAGIKAFEVIVKTKGIKKGEEAIEIAVQEFARYNNGDYESLQDFRALIEKELQELKGARIIKAKTRALKKIWEIEGRALLGPQKRNRIVLLRVTDKEYEKLITKAQEEGLNISNYIRKRLGLHYKS